MFSGFDSPTGLRPSLVGLTITDTPHSIRVLWTSDQPVAETNAQHSQQTELHATGGIRNRTPRKQVATDPRLRPCGYRDRQIMN